MRRSGRNSAATCTSELAGGRSVSTNSSRTVRIVTSADTSTTKYVSFTTSDQPAAAASSARPTFSNASRVCASQSPGGAVEPSAFMATCPEIHTTRAGRAVTTWLYPGGSGMVEGERNCGPVASMDASVSEPADPAVERLERVDVALHGGGRRAGVAVADRVADGGVLGVDVVAHDQRPDRLVQPRLDDGVKGRQRHHEHAVLGRFRDGAVKADVEAQPGLGRELRVARGLEHVVDRAQVRRRPPLGRQRPADPFERPARLEQLGDVDRVEVEEDVHRLAE